MNIIYFQFFLINFNIFCKCCKSYKKSNIVENIDNDKNNDKVDDKDIIVKKDNKKDKDKDKNIIEKKAFSRWFRNNCGIQVLGV